MAPSRPKDVNFSLRKRKIMRKLLEKTFKRKFDQSYPITDDQIDRLVFMIEQVCYAREYVDAYEGFQDDTDEPPPEGWSKFLSNEIAACEEVNDEG